MRTGTFTSSIWPPARPPTLTPLPGVRAEIEAVEPPVSQRNPDRAEPARSRKSSTFINSTCKTAKPTRVEKHRNFSSFVIDDDYRIRFADKMTDNGGKSIMEARRQGRLEDLYGHLRGGRHDHSPIGLDKSGNILYMFDSRGRIRPR